MGGKAVGSESHIDENVIAVKMENIVKKFGSFTANDGINLTVHKGEVHSILGENGAGKSTLMNVLYGMYRPTSGQIYIKGEKVDITSPKHAIELGIGMVHQHFMLIQPFTVTENIVLGIEPVKGVKIDYKLAKKKVLEISEKYGMQVDPDAKIEDISVGMQQRVEILKMLYRNVDILILDEPTAVLTPKEVDDLIATLKLLKEQGKTIIVITHKLREVMELADSITVLKHGNVVGDVLKQDTDEKEIARMMVGRDVCLTVQNDRKHTVEKQVVYQVDNLNVLNDDGKKVINNVSFKVNKGEIFGIAGVEGNGQSELIKVLTGLMEAESGDVILYGKNVTNRWPKELRKEGIGIIPEDRYATGLCREMSVSDNCIAGYHDNKEILKYGLYNSKKIDEIRDKYIDEFDIRLGDKNGVIGNLSGGNAQKVIIARELASKPKILMACQPTRGGDIGSIVFIHKEILKFRDQGNTVILVSSELSEIMSLSDRVIVMYKGQITGEISPTEVSTVEIGLLMAGIKWENKHEK